MKTHIYIIALIVIGILLVYLCAFFSYDSDVAFNIGFYINEDKVNDISIITLEDGEKYVFLPSYTELSKVYASVSGKVNIFLDEYALRDGDCCERFQFDKKYQFVVDGEQSVIQFKKSANVATLFVNTITGDMERVHDDSNFEETASITLYRTNGTVDYQEDVCYINGRGNTTWGQEKKPYLLKLSKDANLLGMGTSSKWVLLANAHDESNLNNKIVLDIASELGLEYTSKSEYVDVYLNGEYNGLYLITEKVDEGKDQVDIDAKNGEFLCRVEYPQRWNIIRNPIETQSGRVLEIVAPKFLTQDEILTVVANVNKFEQELLKGNYSTVIDEESWIKKYLMDEISGNGDADVASSFMYYKNGLIYSGPVWDYDVTFGNYFRNENPDSFIAKNEYKYSGSPSVYYHALYNNSNFYQNMISVYQNELLPILEKYINSQINEISNDIYIASELNSFRWKEMYESVYMYDGMTKATADTIIEYLRKRVLFLNDVWIEGTPYCTIQLETNIGSAYRNIAVKCGETYDPTEYGDVWIIKNTGEIYDKTKPIYEDTILTLKTDALTEEIQGTPVEERTGVISLRYMIVIASVLSMILFLVVLCFIDIARYKNAGGNCHQNKRNI